MIEEVRSEEENVRKAKRAREELKRKIDEGSSRIVVEGNELAAQELQVSGCPRLILMKTIVYRR